MRRWKGLLILLALAGGAAWHFRDPIAGAWRQSARTLPVPGRP